MGMKARQYKRTITIPTESHTRQPAQPRSLSTTTLSSALFPSHRATSANNPPHTPITPSSLKRTTHIRSPRSGGSDHDGVRAARCVLHSSTMVSAAGKRKTANIIAHTRRSAPRARPSIHTQGTTCVSRAPRQRGTVTYGAEIVNKGAQSVRRDAAERNRI
jgi:hypothetical protein